MTPRPRAFGREAERLSSMSSGTFDRTEARAPLALALG